MLEYFWNVFSFDILPTLPLKFNFLYFVLLFLFSFIPAGISYIKQSLQRYTVYFVSAFNLFLFIACVFIPIDDLYFNRGDITIFAKTLYFLNLCLALFDFRSQNKAKIFEMFDKLKKILNSLLGKVNVFIVNNLKLLRSDTQKQKRNKNAKTKNYKK